uniref:Metallo-beta-lactamase domain-containing protein n=1 Tax=Chromera velia CCMP2878 TaxID=1169474 RepID=A0A0G4HE38_9ALVE|eukprot:Cvel_26643.t1-p1 / transcript=Cvel_26643.t1 / gene=Cvel_26643 / organism=Chromera_velia_CCMP2878 / gene_product=Nuclear ribonuclease Z, putative / transcript_product=Nuclear ribonuclease Z, putative / location=Cvel_scaffold3204:3477-6043(+) / protein_length=338 / sequence_SO=supercontig / SO=protein_coding / is_pseudo=false
MSLLSLFMANILASERCKLRLETAIGPLTFVGVSRAGSGTAIACPDLKLQLDAGMNVHDFHPDAVFVTHCHADHSFRLTHFVSRSKPPIFFMPEEMVEAAENFLFHSQVLSNGEPMSKDQYETNHKTQSVRPGETLQKFVRQKHVYAEVIRCVHRAPCVGYVFGSRVSKLAAHLVGAPKDEIARRAQAGEKVTEEREQLLFGFMGDTTAEVFTPSEPAEDGGENQKPTGSLVPFLERGLPALFVECSFLLEEEMPNARKTGHMHYSELKPVLLQYPDTTFILTHFSRRYSFGFVRDFFAKERENTEGGLQNVKLFIAPDDPNGFPVHDLDANCTKWLR